MVVIALWLLRALIKLLAINKGQRLLTAVAVASTDHNYIQRRSQDAAHEAKP